MGTPISTGVLRALRRLYQLGSSGIPSVERLDEASPIQLVHDVSRQAERGLNVGDGGFVTVQTVLTHAGADTQTETIDVYAGLATLLSDVGLKAEDVEVWLTAAAMRLSASNLTAANLAVEQGNWTGFVATGNPARPTFDLLRWGASFGYVTSAGLVEMAVPTTTQSRLIPHRLPQNSLIGLRSTSTGAMEVHVAIQLWVGVRGIDRPPL